MTPVTCPGPHACSQASFACKLRINIARYTSLPHDVFMAGVVLQASANDPCDLSWTTRLLSGIIRMQIAHQHCSLYFLAA